MNTDRTMRFAMALFIRHGLKFLPKGQTADPNVKQAQKSMRMLKRLRRM